MSAATAMTGETVQSVAYEDELPYTVGMPRQRGEDELTSREAATLLGVSLVRFYDLVRGGLVQKHYREFAKRPYYSRREVQRLLEEERARRMREVQQAQDDQ